MAEEVRPFAPMAGGRNLVEFSSLASADGTNWQVREYEDNGGVFATGTWQKTIDGMINIQQEVTGGAVGTNTETLIKALVNANYRATGSNNTSPTSVDITIKFSSKTTTTVDVVTTVNGAYSAVTADMLIIGRWRT